MGVALPGQPYWTPAHTAECLCPQGGLSPDADCRGFKSPASPMRRARQLHMSLHRSRQAAAFRRSAQLFSGRLEAVDAVLQVGQ